MAVTNQVATHVDVVELTARQAEVMRALEDLAPAGGQVDTSDLYPHLAEAWQTDVDRARSTACAYLANQLQDHGLVQDEGYGAWSTTGKPWTRATIQPTPAAPRVHDPNLEPESLKDLRDHLLRTLRAHPWIQLDRAARLVHADQDTVTVALEQLLDEDLVEQDDHDRWALEGTKPEPADPYGPRPLTDNAREMIARVHQHPWEPASTYAELKGGTRFASYSQLDHLTKRGKLQMTVKDGVKHWGPPDQAPPEGHMAMQPGARSPVRQALRPRILNLLALDPWQTCTTIAEQLEANRKGVDTRLRMMLDEQELRREHVAYHGSRTVYAWALADQPAITDDDRDRVRDEQRDRMPDHYYSTQDRVLTQLDRKPWSTARQIADAWKALTMSKVQAALARLRDRGDVQRVPDGEYRYALPGAELDRTVTGHLERGGNSSTQLDAALEVLTHNGGIATPELQDQVEEHLGRDCPGLSQQLNKAHKRGILGKRKARRGSGRQRYAVTEWWIKERPTPDPADLIGKLNQVAKQLRDQGWTVDVDAQPPTPGGDGA